MTPTDFSPVKVGSLDETADYEGDEWDTSRVDEEEEKVANGMRSDTVNMLGELAGGSADATPVSPRAGPRARLPTCCTSCGRSARKR